MSIDWSKAPEWAEAHGVVHCVTSRCIWFNGEVYMYVGDTKSYKWNDDSAVRRYNHRTSDVTGVEFRPSAWTGKGLPPVGTVCEFSDHKKPETWTECRVIAFDEEEDSVVFKILRRDSLLQYDSRYVSSLRPIRTPEQIAEEEREKAINEMAELSLYGHYAFTLAQAKIACAVLHDKGYRKVTP